MSVETFQSPKLRTWFVTVQPSVLARRPSNGCKLWPCCVNVKKSPLKRSFALFWTNSQWSATICWEGWVFPPNRVLFFFGQFLGVGQQFFFAIFGPGWVWGQGARKSVFGLWGDFSVGRVWWWLWGQRFWLEAWYSMIYKNSTGKQLVVFSCRYTGIPSTPEECHHLQRNHQCLWGQWSMATCFAALCRLQHNIETQHCDLQRSDSVEFF